MREIKFRVWHKLLGEMWSWDKIRAHFYLCVLESDVDVPMQFTGLLDRNGKEVYEGDIVKGATDIFDKFTGQVSYAGVCFLIDGVGKYKKIREELNNSFEVIGNIYENPELLGGTDDGR